MDSPLRSAREGTRASAVPYLPRVGSNCFSAPSRAGRRFCPFPISSPRFPLDATGLGCRWSLIRFRPKSLFDFFSWSLPFFSPAPPCPSSRTRRAAWCCASAAPGLAGLTRLLPTVRWIRPRKPSGATSVLRQLLTLTICAAAFISALIVGVSLHYHKIVQNEHYGYPDEWFPSVSATIGDRFPERSFFMLFIAVTSGMRRHDTPTRQASKQAT